MVPIDLRTFGSYSIFFRVYVYELGKEEKNLAMNT